MIEATISPKGFTILGHANYMGEGLDIVCAAVSSLGQSIALAMQKECNAFVISDKDILFVGIDNYNVIERILIETLMVGLKEIEKEFPENIKVTIKKG